MKIYTPILFFIFLIFLGFKIDSVSAYAPGCNATTAYSATTGVSCNATFPSGCKSSLGYSRTTGIRCDTVFSTSLIPGCVFGNGFSITTGQSCSLPFGCSSLSGYSRNTGARCDTSTYSHLPGCNSYYGFSSTTNESCNISTFQSPIISQISAPNSLRLNQTGTWTFAAYDPNGGELMFEAEWGDGDLSSHAPSTGISFVQRYVTFTHAYHNTGTYDSMLSVRNYNGDLTQRTFRVEVD